MGRANTVDLDLIRKELLMTWQPVAAIATRAGIPTKTALKGCLKLWEMGEVKKAYSSIDGHNKVHHFKFIEYTTIFNVRVPVDTSGDEI
jgi:hypothetical protein